jgi:hypothetical protein
MDMKTTGIAIAAVIVAAGAAAFFWRESVQSKSDLRVLQDRVAELEGELETARTAAKPPADNGKGNDELKSELIRLRGELTQRRESGKLAEKLQTENARLVQENHELKVKVATREAAQVQPPAVTGAQPVPQVIPPGEPAAASVPAGIVTPQGNSTPVASDRLAAYRRNAELMKRYFPQLYQQTYGTNEVGATNSAPPQ